MSVQGAVASEVSRILAIELLPDRIARMSQAAALPPNVRTDFLLGRHLMGRFTMADTRLAVEYFDRVLAADGTFSTDETSIHYFLDKYFVNQKSDLLLGNEDTQKTIRKGGYAVGMTKQQVFMSLGPPVFVDQDIPALNLSRDAIFAKDRWTYHESLVMMFPTAVEFIFHDNLLQEAIR